MTVQVTLMLLTKFQVNWPFGSGEEANNRFSRWRPSWISDLNNFICFWSTSDPDASYQISSQLAFWFRRRCEKYFQDGGPGSRLAFPLGTILAIVDLQVTLMYGKPFYYLFYKSDI